MVICDSLLNNDDDDDNKKRPLQRDAKTPSQKTRRRVFKARLFLAALLSVHKKKHSKARESAAITEIKNPKLTKTLNPKQDNNKKKHKFFLSSFSGLFLSFVRSFSLSLSNSL